MPLLKALVPFRPLSTPALSSMIAIFASTGCLSLSACTDSSSGAPAPHKAPPPHSTATPPRNTATPPAAPTPRHTFDSSRENPPPNALEGRWIHSGRTQISFEFGSDMRARYLETLTGDEVPSLEIQFTYSKPRENADGTKFFSLNVVEAKCAICMEKGAGFPTPGGSFECTLPQKEDGGGGDLKIDCKRHQHVPGGFRFRATQFLLPTLRREGRDQP